MSGNYSPGFSSCVGGSTESMGLYGTTITSTIVSGIKTTSKLSCQLPRSIRAMRLRPPRIRLHSASNAPTPRGWRKLVQQRQHLQSPYCHRCLSILLSTLNIESIASQSLASTLNTALPHSSSTITINVTTVSSGSIMSTTSSNAAAFIGQPVRGSCFTRRWHRIVAWPRFRRSLDFNMKSIGLFERNIHPEYRNMSMISTIYHAYVRFAVCNCQTLFTAHFMLSLNVYNPDHEG